VTAPRGMWPAMWIWLTACGDEIGGHLVSSTDTPLASVPVHTSAGDAVTGSDGGFRAAPNTPVGFTYNGVEYLARAVREAPFHLPAMRKVEVRCPADAACDLVLDFGTHDELSAVTRHSCEPGGSFKIDSPNHEPTAVCEGGRALYVDNRLERIDLYPEGRVVDVRLESAGPLPEGCEVWIDSVPLAAVAPGQFTGQARGVAWAGGRCAGRPLAPVELERTVDRATLVVPTTGPELRVDAVPPGVVEVVISDSRGWSVNVRPTDGVFLLPALPAGDHRLELRGPAPRQGTTTTWPTPVADGLTLIPAGADIWLGVWRTPADAIGPVTVHRAGFPPSGG
jgi:hypothetical protein